MISRLVGYICIFGINLLVAYLTGIRDVKMFAVSRLDVVLNGMKLRAFLSTQEAGIPSPGVASDKVLQLFIPV